MDTACKRRIERRGAAMISLAALLLVAYLLPGTTLAQIIDFQELSYEAGTFPVALDDVTGNDDDFGEAAGAIGDLDGDDVPDIVLTAQSEDDVYGGLDTGAIWITFLNPDGTVKRLQEISNTEPSGFSAVLNDGAQFGGQVGNLGDLDGDGITDIAVSSRPDGDDGTPDDGGTRSTGAFWILFLNEDGSVKDDQKISLNEGGLLGGLTGVQPGSWFGEITASPLGDLDRDGVPDTVVGARSDDDGGLNRGAVHVLFLNSDGTVKAQQKISDTQGGFTGQLDDGDVFGDEVEALGDLDGDGIADVAAFAKGDDDGGRVDAGAVWILFLNRDGTVKAHQKISETEGGFTPPLQNYSAFGETIVSMGDLDGDDVTDIAVGADYHDDGAKDTGALWLLYLNRNGTVKAQQQIGSMTPEFAGVLGNFDNFGNDGANIGDLNGDGVADLVVTADSDDGVGQWIPVGEYGHAAAYIFFLEGAVARPDFVVTNITLSPTSPSAGATFSASVTVRNQGTASGSGGSLSVWVNQAAAASCGATGTQQLSVGTLAAGASRTLTFTGLPAGTAGTRTFRAFVDSACVTAESNEANNQLTRTYTVVAPSALPDFLVTAITLTPTSPRVGATFSAAVTVKNQGSVSASAGYLSVYFNRTTPALCGVYGSRRQTVGILAAGASKTLIFTGLPSGTAGTKTFLAFVDSACMTAESNESNNQLSLKYRVY